MSVPRGDVTGEVALLEREVYAEAEAARLLGMPQATLHYWLEGGQRRGKAYQPIIRPDPTGSRIVTWGEFVESALLRAYRKQSIPMAQLRLFIQTLRDRRGVPYPLAHHQPWRSGRDLLFAAQEEAGLPMDFWLVSNSQGLLTPSADRFVEQVSWEDDIATRLRPHRDPKSPVRVDPRVRFGAPAVRGISTSALADQVEAGSTISEVADDYGLPPIEVRWAVAYEDTKAA